MKKQWIITICRLLLILLWVYVAGAKLFNHESFLFSLSRQPIPHWSISILAIALPLVELGAAILLSFEKLWNQGFLISFILMAVFTLYVSLALSGAFGEIPCSCGGIISMLKWKGHLIFNVCYTLIAWFGWRLNISKCNNDSTILNNQLIGSADM